MRKFIVNGGRKLEGEVEVHSAKNAILPILAATILNSNDNVIKNCPKFSDVTTSIEILKSLGATAEYEGENLVINSAPINNYHIPEKYSSEMRASVVFLGSLLARCGKASIGMPGGCEIGHRPIDLHLKAFKQMGVTVQDNHDNVVCTAENLHDSEVHLSFPSVGATENIMLLAAGSGHTIHLTNPAKEPEIVDLQNYLNKIGAKVSGAGTGEITIQGTQELNAVEHRAIPDRIVASTYLCAAAATGGKIILTNVIPEDLNAVLEILRDMGCIIDIHKSALTLTAPPSLRSVDFIRTMPHPGFPTDAQAMVMAALSVAEGTSIFSENIFDNRYKHAEMLCRMGADIKIDGRLAVVRGIGKEGVLGRLTGCKVEGKDLRGTAALIIAALNANGTAEISGLEYLERGYVNFDKNIRTLGGDITLSE